MKRTNLKLASPAKRNGPSFGELRRALRLWTSEYASKETRRRNATAWLRSVHQLGPNWILAGRKEVSWGAKQQGAAK